MSTQFVRYTPDIEATDPYFDENSQIVIDKLEEYITGSVTTEGTGRAVRDAHAKGYGVVKAEVEILGQLPAEYAQGIYAVPGKHGALIRFSNGQPHAGPDMLLGPVVGMALKIFDINGPVLLEDEPDTGTFDYATINAPRLLLQHRRALSVHQRPVHRGRTVLLSGAPRPASLLP